MAASANAPCDTMTVGWDSPHNIATAGTARIKRVPVAFHPALPLVMDMSGLRNLLNDNVFFVSSSYFV
jgi:hypothetical protein